MIKDSYIPIVFSTDHNFIMPTGVAINSLLYNSKQDKYNIIIIIGEDVSDSDKLYLKRICESFGSSLKFIRCDYDFEKSHEIRGITRATYFRLRIPWLLPQYDKIIYCDGDVIFKSNLRNLYNLELGDKYIGAVKDFSQANEFKKYVKSIGLNWDSYINAGVLLINSKQLREDNIDQKFKKLSLNKYRYQDQDILNIVCKNRILFISPIYNFNVNVYETALNKNTIIKNRYLLDATEIIENNIILHYCGDKPWKNYMGYLCFDWMIEYKRTMWFNPLKELHLYQNIYYPRFTFKYLIRFIRSIVR